MKYVIQVDSLHKSYGARAAVKDLSFTVQPGDIYGFLGPNGAGKTTTIRILLGLVRANRGSIRYFGSDCGPYDLPTRARIGALVELPAFFPYLTAKMNLKILARTLGAVNEKQIDELLGEVDLHERAHSKVKTYSQGMRQRLGIAQALLGNPELIILDEPTNGLDPKGISEIRKLIKRLSREKDITFFISSHLLAEVEQLCNSVAIIDKGLLLAQGKIEQMLAGVGSIIEVEVDNRDKALTAVASIPEVGKIRNDGENRFCVEGDFELSAQINRRLHECGVKVYELRRRKKTLEEIFLAMTAEQIPGAEGRGLGDSV